MIPTQISILPPIADIDNEFLRWVVQYCDHASIVLDVGAGKGRSGDLAIIRQKVAHLVGVDPDAGIMENPYLDERYRTSIEHFAKDRSSDFNCLYTISVLEHITEPAEFLSACRSLLKPGGFLFGLTTNLWHYFGIATKLSASLGVEDWLLERLIGTQHKEAYHFPTTYRLNSIRTIGCILAQTGFREVEFRCFDETRGFKAYLPKVLRWFPSVYSRLVYTLGLPHMMGYIMFRATRGE